MVFDNHLLKESIMSRVFKLFIADHDYCHSLKTSKTMLFSGFIVFLRQSKIGL